MMYLQETVKRRAVAFVTGFLILAAVVSSPCATEADEITYRFSAPLTFDFGVFREGDLITGTFQFESDDLPVETNSIRYTYLQVAPLAEINFEYHFASGAPTLSFSSEPTTDIELHVVNTSSQDRLDVFYTDPRQLPIFNGYYWDDIGIRLQAPPTLFDTFDLPAEPLEFDDFDFLTLQMTVRPVNGGGGYQPSIPITQFELVQVPEPGSATVVGMLFISSVLARRRVKA